MKPVPAFLLGMALLALFGSASAQTTPPAAPKTPVGKGAPLPKKAAAPARTASAVKMDTAAFRRSGRPADHIRTRPRPIPSKN
ncbi:MAG TPA: hypothetical protein VF629_06345 [Hymenobacter sp.]|uniref:hypothetical protein n=1 Tax=Hymenobacter sp. TaxID=1898978 RepID=UPI002ED89459